VDAVASSKGKSCMHMVSPASGGLPRRRKSSYNFGPSRPKPWSMPPCSTRMETGTTSSTTGRPLPWEGVGLWSRHVNVDYPPMGVVYQWLLQLLSATANAADRRHFRAFGEGIALACGSPDPTAPNPFSAADSSWKRVAYGKATLSAATAAWEGHRHGASKAPRPPTNFDNLSGGPAWEKEGNQAWGDNWGYCRPNTPPTDVGTHRTEAPVPAVPAPVAVPGGLDLAALIFTLLKAQADAQLARPMPTMRTLLHSELRRPI
jgi:hypothetical protein